MWILCVTADSCDMSHKSKMQGWPDRGLPWLSLTDVMTKREERRRQLTKALV